MRRRPVYYCLSVYFQFSSTYLPEIYPVWMYLAFDHPFKVYYKVRWFVITKCDRTTHKTHTCNCMFFCTQGLKPLKLTWQPDDAGNVTRVFVRTLLLAYPWKRSQPVKTNQTIPPRVYFYVSPEITYKLWRNIHKRGGSYRWSVHRY